MGADAEQRIGLPEHRPPHSDAVAPRALSAGGELARKSLHLLSASVPIAYALGAPWIVLALVLAALLTIAVALEIVRDRSEAARAHFVLLAGRLLREHEHRRWAGATWLLVSFLGAVLLLPRDVAIASMWAVSVGDAAAAIVGRSLGIGRLRGSSKTLAGSAACWLSTFAGASLVAQLGVAESLVAATAAALLEWPRRPLDDNLRVLAAVATGILLWRIVFP